MRTCLGLEIRRGHVVVVWEGTEINNDKFRVLNVIAVKKCVEFCMKCWKHRNEACHDMENNVHVQAAPTSRR